MKNKNKDWKQIVQELLEAGLEAAAWDYVTALRGPDVPCEWLVKATFTGPLRCECTCQGVTNASDFRRLSLESITEASKFAYERRHELLHYLMHVESAWRVLHRKVSFLLRGLVSFEPPEDSRSWAKEYRALVNEWLDRECAVGTGGQDD